MSKARIANLHLHSVFSDGTQWPEEIVIRAKHAGYQMIALTDHDTMRGIGKFCKECWYDNIMGVPGVEIDCVAPDFSFDKEMLGYFPKRKFQKTSEFTEGIRKNRMSKINHFLDRARDVVFKAYPRSPELTYTELVRFKLGFTNDQVMDLPFSWNKSNFYNFLLSKGILGEQGGGGGGSKAKPDEGTYKAFKAKYFAADLLGDPYGRDDLRGHHNFRRAAVHVDQALTQGISPAIADFHIGGIVLAPDVLSLVIEHCDSDWCCSHVLISSAFRVI